MEMNVGLSDLQLRFLFFLFDNTVNWLQWEVRSHIIGVADTGYRFDRCPGPWRRRASVRQPRWLVCKEPGKITSWFSGHKSSMLKSPPRNLVSNRFIF
jgi:hypothetical protein